MNQTAALERIKAARAAFIRLPYATLEEEAEDQRQEIR